MVTMYYLPLPQPFSGPFSGPRGWAAARRELLDFMVQGKINRGRHAGNLAGRHSIQTNQCPPPPSPHFLQAGCPSCRPTNSVKALKATCIIYHRLKIFCAHCSTVHGRIDQVHQLLELNQESTGVARYNGMDKWSAQIASLHEAIINRVA